MLGAHNSFGTPEALAASLPRARQLGFAVQAILFGVNRCKILTVQVVLCTAVISTPNAYQFGLSGLG
jgi:hypothetical protein